MGGLGSGGRPTPTRILKARGSWRAKLRPNEPQPGPGVPKCPAGFGKAEKSVWRAVVRILADMGLITTADGSMLERYCRYFVRWRACEEFVAKNGQTYALKAVGKDANTPPKGGYVGKLPSLPGQPVEYVISWQEFPQVRESQRLHKALKDVEDRFGLTPAARGKVQSMSELGPKLHDDGEAALRMKFFGSSEEE